MAKVRFNIPKDATDQEVVDIIREAAAKAELAEGPDGVPEGGVGDDQVHFDGDLPDDNVETGSEFL